jgi:hypothetical protein
MLNMLTLIDLTKYGIIFFKTYKNLHLFMILLKINNFFDIIDHLESKLNSQIISKSSFKTL